MAHLKLKATILDEKHCLVEVVEQTHFEANFAPSFMQPHKDNPRWFLHTSEGSQPDVWLGSVESYVQTVDKYVIDIAVFRSTDVYGKVNPNIIPLSAWPLVKNAVNDYNETYKDY